MAESQRALIFSISPPWMEAILVGEKKFELRRRPPHLLDSIPALLYETLPKGRIRAKCMMGPVFSASKSEVWKKIGFASAVSRSQFNLYFDGLKLAHAISINGVQELFPPLLLADLKKRIGFNPPQSWCWASPQLLSLVEAQI